MGDLHRFDPAADRWTNLTDLAAGSAPMARFGHGMAGAGISVYVFGGCGSNGAESAHSVFFVWLKQIVCAHDS